MTRPRVPQARSPVTRWSGRVGPRHAPLVSPRPPSYAGDVATDEQLREKLRTAILTGVRSITVGNKRIDYNSTAEMLEVYEKAFGPLAEVEAGRTGAGRSFMTTRARFNRGDH